MLYRIAWWTGMATGAVGAVTVYYDHWRMAAGLGVVAVICAVIGLWELRQ